MLSSRVVQASAGPLGAHLAEALHDALQHGLDDAQERPLRGVAVPAGFHQLPALLVEHREALWAGPWGKAREQQSRGVVSGGQGETTEGREGLGGRSRVGGRGETAEGREGLQDAVSSVSMANARSEPNTRVREVGDLGVS